MNCFQLGSRWLVIFATSGMVVLQAQTPTPPSPGFHRMRLGDFEIVALSDGVVPWRTATLFPTATPGLIDSTLRTAGVTDPVGMSYSAFLVNTGNKVVLIDAGTGSTLDTVPGFQGTGHLLANLRAAGYEPSRVDEIYITHMGPDHVGGLMSGSERTFPNAIVRIAKREVDTFLDPARARRPDSAWYRFRSQVFEPYARAGRSATFDRDLELLPGIRAMATPGHTPGHTSYVVESGGQRMIVLGDVVHVAAFQFSRPTIPTIVDVDRLGGGAQRERVFKLAAEEGYWIAGSHLPFPGLGHVRSEQGRFRWEAAP